MIQNKHVNIGVKDIISVVTQLRKKDLSGTSTTVERYENELNNLFNSDYSIAVSNGTLALEMIIRASGLQSGEEVMLPPTAPVMSLEPIINNNLTPVFVDVKRNEGFSMDIQDMQSKLTSKTKAILTVPMWGYPINIEEIVNFAEKNNLIVVEDCSQAHITKYKNKALGTFGDFGFFSTHERKLITTGEGAFILTRSEENFTKLRKWRNFGKADLPDTKNAYGIDNGGNYKLSAINASLGISQINKVRKKIKKRKDNRDHLMKKIEGFKSSIHEINYIQGGTPNYYGLVLHVKNNKRSFDQYLAENGIFSDTHRYQYDVLYKLPLYKSFNGGCSNAESLVNNIISIPVHEGLSKKDLSYIANNFISYLKNHE